MMDLFAGIGKSRAEFFYVEACKRSSKRCRRCAFNACPNLREAPTLSPRFLETGITGRPGGVKPVAEDYVGN